MIFHSVTFPKNAKDAYLVPIGDIHLGSTAFGARGRKLLKGYLEWVKARPNARIVLMGDLFDVATRTSATPPSESSSSEYTVARELFRPYASQICASLLGNHCARLKNFAGYDPMEQFCDALGIPYLGYSGIVRFDVQKQSYFGYFHHSTGGGGTLGSALNRATKLQDIVQDVDFYCIGHNHNLVNGVKNVYAPNKFGTGIEERRLHYIDCGSYLDYPNSYAEQMMLTPGKLGSPRIRFDGAKHDIHVSL
jgi:hypothetical protein